MEKSKIKGNLTIRPCSLLTAWLLAVMLEFLRIPKEWRFLGGLTGISMMSGIRIVSQSVVYGILLHIVFHCFPFKKAERWVFVCVAVSYMMLSVISSFTWTYLGSCILIVVLLCVYGQLGWEGRIPVHPATLSLIHI